MLQHLMQGVRQEELRRVTCQWGDYSRSHSAILPFFQADYKVFGLMGFSLGTAPAWYPGVPVHIEKRMLLFKDAYADAPPPLAGLDEETFADAYYYDPWRVLAAVFATEPGFPPLAGALNLADQKLLGKPITDLLFEAQLHRLRGFVLKGWLFRVHRISTLQIPNLAEAIEPLGDQGRPRPGMPQDLGEFLKRLLGTGRRAPPPPPEPGGEPSPKR
jgi:hypothetical protein